MQSMKLNNNWAKDWSKCLVTLNKLDAAQNKEYPYVVDWCTSAFDLPITELHQNFNEKSYITKTVHKPKIGLIQQVRFKDKNDAILFKLKVSVLLENAK